MKRGALIILEGCDRVGKTTQCKLLVEKLKAKDVAAEYMSFPDRTTCLGKILDDYLGNKAEVNDKAIHLLFSGNRWELESKMKKLLSHGTTLVIDRYAYSGVAYSAAKEGMTLDWCRRADVGLPKPDAVFLLKIGRDSLHQRPGFGEERYENDTFLNKVWANYQALKDETFKEIDADKTIEDLNQVLVTEALTVVHEVKEKPLDTLWTSS